MLSGTVRSRYTGNELLVRLSRWTAANGEFTSAQVAVALRKNFRYVAKKLSAMKKCRMLDARCVPRRDRFGRNRGYVNVYRISRRGRDRVAYLSKRLLGFAYLASGQGRPEELLAVQFMKEYFTPLGHASMPSNPASIDTFFLALGGCWPVAFAGAMSSSIPRLLGGEVDLRVPTLQRMGLFPDDINPVVLEYNAGLLGISKNERLIALLARGAMMRREEQRSWLIDEVKKLESAVRGQRTLMTALMTAPPNDRPKASDEDTRWLQQENDELRRELRAARTQISINNVNLSTLRDGLDDLDDGHDPKIKLVTGFASRMLLTIEAFNLFAP